MDTEGMVLTDELINHRDEDIALLTVMLANNETGNIMQIRRLADVAHGKGALVHTDAAQAVGKIPVDVEELGAICFRSPATRSMPRKVWELCMCAVEL